MVMQGPGSSQCQGQQLTSGLSKGPCLNVQLFRPCPASPQVKNLIVGTLWDTVHETEEAAAVLWAQALHSYCRAPDLTFSSHVEIGNLQSAFCIVL